jgi:hypothetical protein
MEIAVSKAEYCITKITRRAAIAATLAGVGAPAAVDALLPDPVLAAIAAHKAAYAALDQVCLRLSRLEGQIPQARRKEWFAEDRAAGVGADDDPRWTAVLAAYHAASDAVEQAAWALAHARPAGLAGAAALLRHAYEHEAEGCDWPCDPEEEDGDDWHGAFHRNLAAALDALA